MKPKRIQRSRAKGSRLPAGAVCVTRGTKWGNPYKLTSYQFANSDGTPKPHDEDAAREMSVRDFEGALLVGDLPFTVEDVRRELKGKTLACWCPLGKICHGDTLLRVANGGELWT